MKFELIRNLKGNEILAKTIYNEDGKTMVPSGITLSKSIINNLKNHGFYYVYIESDFVPTHHNMMIEKMKSSAVESLPNVFNTFLEGNIIKIAESVNSIENLVDTIIDDNDININLYEIQQYDEHLYIHCVDTGIMAILLGKQLNLSRNELKSLGTGAFLHDIGKIKISQDIINKNGTLTTDEFRIIKKHPVFGYSLLKNAGIKDNIILSCVLYHHERVDGKGYPQALKNDRLSSFAKIVSICDVYTAISANRSYRPRFNPNEAYEFILSGINTRFDESLVNTFKETFCIYPIGCKVKLSNGLQGEVTSQNKGFPDRPIIKMNYDCINNRSIESFNMNLMENLKVAIMEIVP